MTPPRREEAGNRIVDLEHAALEQLHQRDRRDRLGHRVDPEDRVVADRDPTLSISEAERSLIREMATPPDRHLAPGNLAGVDVVALEMGADAVEPLRHRILRRAVVDPRGPPDRGDRRIDDGPHDRRSPPRNPDRGANDQALERRRHPTKAPGKHRSTSPIWESTPTSTISCHVPSRPRHERVSADDGRRAARRVCRTGRQDRTRRRRSVRTRRADRGRDRAERLRQVDHDEGDRRCAGPRHRHDRGARPARRHCFASGARRIRHPGALGVRRTVSSREPHLLRPPARCRGTPKSTLCSQPSHSPTINTNVSATCPGVSGLGSRWRSLSSTTRRCSCSTNRPSASTPYCATSCGPSSPHCPRREPRCWCRVT